MGLFSVRNLPLQLPLQIDRLLKVLNGRLRTMYRKPWSRSSKRHPLDLRKTSSQLCSHSMSGPLSQCTIALRRYIIAAGERAMPYVYSQAKKLKGEKKVGSGECVALVKHYAGAPVTAAWREGETVIGNIRIAPGTAIATFVNGRYLSRPRGNHAAFYVSQDATGIMVVDQWRSSGVIKLRPLKRLGKNKDGTWKDASNNADAFSIIE